jgi:transmembrane sensor
MNNTNFPKEAIKQHLRGQQLSGEQQQQLDGWLAKDPRNQAYFNEVLQPEGVEELASAFETFDPLSIRTKIRTKINRRARVVKMKRIVYTVAASLLLIFGGVYIYKIYKPVSVRQEQVSWKTATDRFRLILSDGKVLYLDRGGSDIQVTHQGYNITWSPSDTTVMITPVVNGVTPDNMEYISLTTPAFCSRRIQLPDGTTTSLNAASGMRIPLNYGKRERKVELSGSAYYSVPGNKNRPFKVVLDSAIVSVLGTSFEVRAYPDEYRIQTGVSEGSVSVEMADTSYLVEKGRSLQLYTNRPAAPVWANINGKGVGIWRSGFLDFTNQDTRGVAEIISKWYGLDTPRFFNGADKMRSVGLGAIGSNLTLKQMFEALESDSLHFELVQKSIYVRRK